MTEVKKGKSKSTDRNENAEERTVDAPKVSASSINGGGL